MSVIKILGIFLVLFFFGNADEGSCREGSPAPFEVRAESEKEEIYIGDRVKITVTAALPRGVEAEFPEKPVETGGFHFISSGPVETGRGDRKRVGREYVMSIYTTGTHVFPPVEVEYRSVESGASGITRSPQLPFKVKSVLSGDDEDIRDIKPVMTIPGVFLPAVIFALALFFAGLAVWARKRALRGDKFFDKKEAPKTPHEIAYDSLKALRAKDLPGKGLVKEYYTELSDIVRYYIEGRFSYRAPEMTTEEFMEHVKRAAGMEKKHRDLLKDFLQHCDMVKFAKYGPTALEIVDSFNAASRFVEQTRETGEGEQK